MFTKVATAVVVLVLALLVFAAAKPDTFRVRRATSINAPPETIFALIDNFRTVGKEFETGLANLKTVAEKQAGDAKGRRS